MFVQAAISPLLKPLPQLQDKGGDGGLCGRPSVLLQPPYTSPGLNYRIRGERVGGPPSGHPTLLLPP